MAAPKGHKRYGGRNKGTPNRASAAKAAEIAASGETPLDFLLRAMRDRKRSFDVRMDAAKAAAPYVHPKLQAIEHSGTLEVTEAEVDADIARLQAEIAAAASAETGDAEGCGEA
jgi:hypothetical protein